MASGELLSPSVMGILGEWGLEDKVRQAGQPLERFIICKENGEEYGSCSLLDPSPGFVGISHYALLAILQHSVSFVQRGVSVSSVKGQPSGQLEVGTTGLGPREKVDVLVGADGVASKVRQLVDASRGSGGEMKASFCNMGTVEAIVQRPPSWEGRNDVVEMWGNGKRLSLMPVSRTHLWISGSFHLPNPVQLGAGPLQIGMIFKRAFQDMEGHGVREAINSLDILVFVVFSSRKTVTLSTLTDTPITSSETHTIRHTELGIRVHPCVCVNLASQMSSPAGLLS